MERSIASALAEERNWRNGVVMSGWAGLGSARRIAETLQISAGPAGPARLSERRRSPAGCAESRGGREQSERERTGRESKRGEE